MGIDYAIFDKDRREFISLHKWDIVNGVYEAIFNGTGDIPQETVEGCSCAIVSKSVLLQSIAASPLQFDYIKELASYIPGAITDWNKDAIYFCSDWVCEPWDYSRPNFYEWMELPGPQYFHDYLPRNLVLVHDCKTWENAKPYLQKHSLFSSEAVNELANIKRKFDLLLQSR